MITPRRTRLVRVRELHAFRDAIVALATEEGVGRGFPLSPVENPSRPLFVVVPTTGAARQLQRLIQHRRGGEGLRQLDLVTRDQLYDRLHRGLVHAPPRLTAYERDVLVQAAAREASTELAAVGSPFQLRAGLVSEMLRFYDQLRRQGQQVPRFEELLEETLGRDAEFDRGAERMLQQTRLLAATFRGYERRAADSGRCDEHMLRERLLVEPMSSPVGGVIVTVADWIADPRGLHVADFDLLARLPGVQTVDLIATDAVLGSGDVQFAPAPVEGLVAEAALGVDDKEAGLALGCFCRHVFLSLKMHRVTTPSPEGHDPARWPQFRKRYWAELKGQGDVLALLKYVTQEKPVTFVYAASDEERNSAVALKELLEQSKKWQC